jgi:uncharacterized membrane protein
VITDSIEINRPAEEVFAYLDQLDRHGEWQEEILATSVETEGPTRVGTRATNRRRVPGGRQGITYEITEHEPPRRVSFQGVNGPVRARGTVLVEPLGESTARVTLEFDLIGHGVGKLLAPLARRHAGRQIPKDQARLKERLEAGAGG